MIRHSHTWIFVISFVLLLFAGFYALTYTTGPPTGNTNAPGDGNCTSCHSGTLVTSGSNWNNINLQSNIPSSGYVPDSTYTMILSQTQSGITRFGFQVTALSTTTHTKAGTLIITNVSTTQLLTGIRDYIEHTSGGTSGSGSISWSFKWKAPVSNIGSIIFYAVINSANNDQTSSGDMILAKTFTYNVSSLLPTAIISVVDSTVCVDDTVFLSGSGTNNPISWAWSMPSGTPSSSTAQNPFVIYKSAGIYIVNLISTNIWGSSLVTTHKIYVAGKPAVTISPAGTINICQGDSASLTAVPLTGLTYLWNTSQTTPVIYVKTAGTYFVTATNSAGCSTISKPVTVIVNFLPSVALASSPDTICKGTAVQFNASPTNFINYTFKSGSTILQNSIKSDYTTTTLLDNIPVFVTVKDLNNCSANSNSINTKVFNPIDTPKVSCDTPTTSTIEYKWLSDTNTIAYEVSEDSGKTWITPSSGPNGISHQISGLTYSESVMLFIRAKDHFPCFYSPVAQLTCSTLPCSAIKYRFVYDSVLCAGDSTSIDLHELNTSKFAINFENQGYSKDTLYPVKPAASIIYTMLLVDSNMLNCPAITLKAKIRVSPLPVVTLTSDKTNDAFCKGDNIELIATAGYANYLFLRNKVDTVQNSSVETVSPKLISDGDRLSVMATNADGCSGWGNDISVTVYPLPVADYTYAQTFLLFNFTDITKHAASWKWNFGDSQSDSIKDPVHTYAAAGLYDVKLIVTDSNGCMDDTIKKVNAINNSIDERSVKLFTVSYIRSQEILEVNYELISPENISVSLMNQSGNVIKTIQPGNQKRGKYSLTIATSELKKGVYIISMNNGNSIMSKKVLID